MNGQDITTHPLEKLLAVLGAAVCLFITVMIWRSVSTYQTIWPLPAIYFIELMGLSLFCAFIFIRSHPLQGYVVWGTIGVLLTFVILGSLSVGFFFLPVLLIFALLALIWDIRNRQPIALHLGVCVIACLAQGALMYAGILLNFPATVY